MSSVLRLPEFNKFSRTNTASSAIHRICRQRFVVHQPARSYLEHQAPPSCAITIVEYQGRGAMHEHPVMEVRDVGPPSYSSLGTPRSSLALRTAIMDPHANDDDSDDDEDMPALEADLLDSANRIEFLQHTHPHAAARNDGRRRHKPLQKYCVKEVTSTT
jgi:hypothetical protein